MSLEIEHLLRHDAKCLYKGRIQKVFQFKMDSLTLNQIPEEYKEIYRFNWKTIKHSVKKGIFKDVYHFPLLDDSDIEIVSKLNEVLANYTKAIKINIAFGFILQERVSKELKFFHPSNNTMVFNLPRLINGPNDVTSVLDDIEKEDLVNYARKQRPSTRWIVDRIICIRFDVYRLM